MKSSYYAVMSLLSVTLVLVGYWENRPTWMLVVWSIQAAVMTTAFVLQPGVRFWARLIVRCFLGRL